MSSIRTLVVDDEPVARDLLRRCLEAYPDLAIVGEARNGREALKRVRETRPHLLFLDVQMPDLNGFEVLERLPGNDYRRSSSSPLTTSSRCGPSSSMPSITC